MRAFLVSTVVILGTLWAIDTLAFEGRYTQAVWQEAKFQGQQLNSQIRYTFRKAGL